MKKTILSIIIATLCIGSIKAQTPPYKHLAEFKTDTVAFVDYNFVKRADYYKDKSLSDLLQDLEITPIASGQGYSVGEDDSFNFTSIRLYLNRQGKKSLFVQIYWKNPAPMPSNIKNLLRKNGMHTWVSRYEDIFKSYRIEKIVTNETFIGPK